MQFMFDVFALAELACPAAARQSAGGVRRYAATGEQGNLLEPGAYPSVANAATKVPTVSSRGMPGGQKLASSSGSGSGHHQRAVSPDAQAMQL
jgi:hypothetical protein